MIKRHAFKVSELKAAEQSGVIDGRASVYGVVDSYGDVVMPGAFTKTLQENGGRIVVLSQHDPSKAIGTAMLEDAADGLHCRIELAMELVDAQQEYARVKAGLVTGISIGYETLRDEFDAKGLRKLLELRLWEISLVTFPANGYARVTSVKRRRKQVGDYVDPTLAAQLSALDAFIDQADALLDNILAYVGVPDTDGDDADDMGAASAAAFAEKARAALETVKAERKAGRMISAANLKKLTSAREALQAAHDALDELITVASATDDDASKAARSTSAPATAGADAGDTEGNEPELLHSITALMSDFKAVRATLGADGGTR